MSSSNQMEMMTTEPRRVVVIQDASRDVSSKGIKKALKKLSLKAGDQFTILAIFDRFNSPMGYKIMVDSSSFVAANKKIIVEELTRIEEYYCTNSSIMKLAEDCKTKEIGFQIDVLAGPLEFAANAAKNCGATCLIFDRYLHNERRHFRDKLPCVMYRITSDNSIEKLHDPKSTPNTNSLGGRPEVTYTEMVQEYSLKNQETGQIAVDHKGKSLNYQEKQSSNMEASQIEEEFTNSRCSVCNNRRPKIGCKRDFTYAELHMATQGFSQKNFLSEGGFGTVYKGQLNGMMIAIKQHKNASPQGEKEFKSEVNLLSKARHENVVMLLGSCSEGKNRFLVYEYVCNGSLDQHLSQHSRTPLSWKDRIRVALGAAEGLLYLHKNSIIHRDMRPNNILMTHDYQLLLGDFGLARNQNQDSIHSTEVVGTLGYLAPEYAEHGKVSTKTDVYSFGVVLLQLITGMRTTDKRLGRRSLVGWARPLLRKRNYPDLIDERIMNSHDFHQLFWMVRIAEKCLSRDPQKRLNMAAVVNALTGIVEGNTCGIIGRDHSPTRSDSFYSTSDSGESEDEMQGSFESESELQIHTIESTSISSISPISQMIIRRPPSPPIESIC